MSINLTPIIPSRVIGCRWVTDAATLDHHSDVVEADYSRLAERFKHLEPIRLFTKRPPPHPRAVCLDVPGTSVTHGALHTALLRALEASPAEDDIQSVHFVARNVVLGRLEGDNRWIVTLGSAASYDALAGRHVHLRGKLVECRGYDGVVQEEYRRFCALVKRVARER